MAGNLIGEPFKSYVNEQIKARQKVHGKTERTLEEISYLNSRNAWIKMASGVALSKSKYKEVTGDGISSSTDGGLLAKNWVLFNGLGKPKNPNNTKIDSNNPILGDRAGISNNGAYGIGGTDFGYSPMPGITDASLKCLNRGSIKKMEVNVIAHNTNQFNIIDALYLRLGYSVFIEWGYDKYLDNNGDLQLMGPSLIDEKFFSSKYSKSDYSAWIPQIEKKRNDTDGNYEGIFGTISNFSWTFQDDGSYKIKIEIISLGDIIESLKTNLPPLGSVTNPFINQKFQTLKLDYKNKIAPEDIFYAEFFPELRPQIESWWVNIRNSTEPLGINDGKATGDGGTLPILLTSDISKNYRGSYPTYPPPSNKVMLDLNLGDNNSGNIDNYNGKNNFSQYFNSNNFIQAVADDNTVVQNNIFSALQYSLINAFTQPSYRGNQGGTPPGYTDNGIPYNAIEWQKANTTTFYYNNTVVYYSDTRSPGKSSILLQTANDLGFGKDINKVVGTTRLITFPTNDWDFKNNQINTILPDTQKNRDKFLSLFTLKQALTGVYLYFVAKGFAGGINDERFNPPTTPTSSPSSGTEISALKNRVTKYFSTIREWDVVENTNLKSGLLLTVDINKLKSTIGWSIIPETTTEQKSWNSQVGFPLITNLTKQRSIPYIFQLQLTEVKDSYFISLGTFLQFLEEKIIPKIENTNTPIIKIDYRPNKNICYCPDNVISTNIRKCIVSNPTFFNENGKNQNDSIFPELFQFKTTSTKDFIWGKIMNVYFNFSRLEEIFSEVDNDNNVSLFKVLKTICNDINECLGNVNNIEPVIQEDNTIQLIDQTPIPGLKSIAEILNIKLNPESAKLEIFGYNNNNSTSTFVNKIGITTEINKKYASMITIGATANGSIPGVEATAFSKWNEGISDRFKNNIVDATNPATSITSPKDNLEIQNKDVIINYKNFLKERGLKINLNSDLRVIVDDTLESNKSIVSNFYKYSQTKLSLESKTVQSSVGFLPFNLKIDMDGLGGIKIYNKLLVNTSFLPKNYGNELQFIITGVNHKISNNQWVTHLDTIATSNQDKVKISNFTTKKVLNSTTPVITVSTSLSDALSSLPIKTVLPPRAVNLSPTLNSQGKVALINQISGKSIWPIGGVFLYNGVPYAEPRPDSASKGSYFRGEKYENSRGKIRTRDKTWFPPNPDYENLRSKWSYGGKTFRLLNNLDPKTNIDLKTALKLTIDEIDNRGIAKKYFKVSGTSGAYRDISSSPGNLSGHAFLVALDINPGSFPIGKKYVTWFNNVLGRRSYGAGKGTFRTPANGSIDISKALKLAQGDPNKKFEIDGGVETTLKEYVEYHYVQAFSQREWDNNFSTNLIKNLTEVVQEAKIVEVFVDIKAPNGQYIWGWGGAFGDPHHFTPLQYSF